MIDKTNDISVTRPLWIGFATLGVLCAGLGVWATQTNISGAVVATGAIRVEGDTHPVSHQLGGVVADVTVENGDTVTANQTLIILDNAVLRAKILGVEAQLLETLAARARWRAIVEAAPELELDSELEAMLDETPSWRERIDQHQVHLTTARNRLLREISRQRQIMAQIREQIAGERMLITSLTRQMHLITAEIDRITGLRDRGLGTVANLFGLERDHAVKSGEIGLTNASIADKQQKLIELDAVVRTLEQATRAEALKELSKLETARSRLIVERAELRAQLDRHIVRSPIDGTVHDRRVAGPGALVVANQPILSIVPDTEPATAVVQIAAADIDQVYSGQEARLRIEAFDARTHPELIGTVQRIAPETSLDPKTKRPTYEVRIAITPQRPESRQAQELVNGMQLVAFLTTSEQTPWAYLTQPVAKFLARTMRDT